MLIIINPLLGKQKKNSCTGSNSDMARETRPEEVLPGENSPTQRCSEKCNCIACQFHAANTNIAEIPRKPPHLWKWLYFKGSSV